MEWITYRCRRNGSSIDRKAECDKLLSHGNVYKILKSAMVGATYYAAAVRTKDEFGPIMPEDSAIFGVIFQTKVYRDMFSYMEMDETVCPAPDKCPMSIIKMLSPTDDKLAIDWRERCRKNALSKASRRSPKTR